MGFASTFDATLYYTHYSGGGRNVLEIAAHYDDVTPALSYGSQVGRASVNGAIGLFSFGASDVTSQLIPANTVTAAHGIVYDPFTGRMTMFGGGSVATLDPTLASNAAIISSLLQFAVPNVCDFDQGAADGFGHAFIAGCGDITFIDYSATHDITSAMS